MDMARHQVPQSLTVRRDRHRRQLAWTIKTRILLEEAGIADNRNMVDRQCNRVAGISIICREVGELLTVDPEADFAGEDEAWRRRWRHERDDEV